MRLFWAGFLATGLILIGLSVLEMQQAGEEPLTTGATVSTSEDGTPMPHPYPTPTPRPKTQ
jgi:hypothetical protein